MQVSEGCNVMHCGLFILCFIKMQDPGGCVSQVTGVHVEAKFSISLVRFANFYIGCA